MKILVADDDAVSRLLLQRMLRTTDFEVITAKDGLEAIQILSRDDGPRLVLLDWTMPGLSGLEVCRAIRGGLRKAYIYIALLTSKDSKEDLVAGLEAGADDYLTKPCHPEELLARLRTGLRILQLEDILIEAHEKMRKHAARDPLTQLLNRGAIFDVLAAKMSNRTIPAAQFSVMLCDLDHFKMINDTYGHAVGDEVLREVALRLKNNVRNGTVGRYGGEEFLLLLDGCGPEHLATVSTRICDAVRSLPVQTSVGPLYLTISCGALPFVQEMADRGPEAVVEEADRRLYQGKRNGRNQAVVAAADLVTA
ncbi:diguanylate cyclase (GGDEF) domain-containing protein [Terriglobus roseus DSM 18391]|uniref:diguanylate cyclase n=1 Tax=Terriglobus roseus (strain DSM 18391 / NRRL B-41598 / KBS 63) TaxID=926566 RepID=I3ZJJ9_TERRK|nr:diguanylate cyclase [Terriglobus roseus]AFL89417.1 diguanylate cyclase (GGDEF) domain-containing protein [Terriglobus roseus DSM 18391]